MCWWRYHLTQIKSVRFFLPPRTSEPGLEGDYPTCRMWPVGDILAGSLGCAVLVPSLVAATYQVIQPSTSALRKQSHVLAFVISGFLVGYASRHQRFVFKIALTGWLTSSLSVHSPGLRIAMTSAIEVAIGLAAINLSYTIDVGMKLVGRSDIYFQGPRRNAGCNPTWYDSKHNTTSSYRSQSLHSLPYERSDGVKRMN
eukprot:1065826-Amorphochlora_amoeboformis.AAC.2